MAYINIPVKDNTTPLTPAEFNYLIDKLNLRKLRDLIDVQDDDAQDKDIIRHNGSGWVFYQIEDDFYTKTEIDSLFGVDENGVPDITPKWGEITGNISAQLDLFSTFGALNAASNIWSGIHYANNYIVTGSSSAQPGAGTMDYFLVSDGVSNISIADGDTLKISGTGVNFEVLNRRFVINTPSFDALPDTPASKTGKSLYGLRVTADELGLEYFDLNSTFAPISHTHNYVSKSGDTMTGNYIVAGTIYKGTQDSANEYVTRQELGTGGGGGDYVHPTYPGDDVNISAVPLTGATVFSNVAFSLNSDGLGHVVSASGSLTTRVLTLADLGFTGDPAANNYVHPAYTTRSVDTSGAVVIDILTSDATGHVTNVTTRTMTLADLGYTGATNANNYVHPTQAAISVAGTVADFIDSVTVNTSGHVTAVTKRTLTLANLGYTGALDANNYVHPAYTGATLAGTGASVVSNITVDTSGHVSSVSLRALTLANLGFTGAVDANNYVHPTGDGNLHVIATGTTNNGKFLMAGSTAGSLSWGTPTPYTHPTLTARNIDATGAQVIDVFTSDTSGHVTNITLRTLTLSDLGYTGAVDANNYVHPTGDGNLHVPATGTTNNGKFLMAGATAGTLAWGTPTAYTHPAYTVRNIDTAGASVIDVLTSDATGHITNITTRTLTLAELGYTGATDANNYAHPTQTAIAVTGTVADFIDSVTVNTLGHVTAVTKRTLTLANLGYTGAVDANNYVHPSGDGNLHVPATSTTNNGKVLTAGATAGSLSWTTPATYTHPTLTARNIDATGAQVIDVFTSDTSGHVTNITVRTLTLADLGYTGATNANFYTLPAATDLALGGVKLFSATTQTDAANTVSATAGKTYGVQVNASGQMVVNVPWVDTNTVYTHPAYTVRNIDTATATVIDVITSDATGHITNITTRVMTLADLGYTGATNANNYVHPTGDGNLHVPANGTGNNGKFLMASGTAGSYSWSDITGFLPLSGGALTGAVTSSSTISADKYFNIGGSKPSVRGLRTGTGVAQSGTVAAFYMDVDDRILVRVFIENVSTGAVVNKTDFVFERINTSSVAWNVYNKVNGLNNGHLYPRLLQDTVNLNKWYFRCGETTTLTATYRTAVEVYRYADNKNTDTPEVYANWTDVLSNQATIPAGMTSIWTSSYFLNASSYYNNYSLPTATTTTLGAVKLGSDTTQSVVENAVTATASRTYAVQKDAVNGRLVVNVPWVDTTSTYTLPAGTDTVLGGIKLFSATAQATAANAVTTTASRTYGLQVNASGQGVVNVPWTDTVYTHPTGAGNNHIPSGGASGNALIWSSSGVAVWGTVATATNASYASYITQGDTSNYWAGNVTTMADHLFHVETNHGFITTGTNDTKYLRALRFGHGNLGGLITNVLASSIDVAGEFRVYSAVSTATASQFIYQGDVGLMDNSSTYGLLKSKGSYLRCPASGGFLPNANGNGALGSSSWIFSAMYANAIYQGTANINTIYLPIATAATKTAGNFIMNDNILLQLGTAAAESDIYSDGTNSIWKIKSGNLSVKDSAAADIMLLTASTKSANFYGTVTSSSTFTGVGFYESSLRKYKTNIEPFKGSAMSIVDSLKVVTYDRIDGRKDKIGIIIDESPKEVANETRDAVDIYNTVFLLTKAVQELKAEIELLKSR